MPTGPSFLRVGWPAAETQPAVKRLEFQATRLRAQSSAGHDADFEVLRRRIVSLQWAQRRLQAVLLPRKAH